MSPPGTMKPGPIHYFHVTVLFLFSAHGFPTLALTDVLLSSFVVPSFGRSQVLMCPTNSVSDPLPYQVSIVQQIILVGLRGRVFLRTRHNKAYRIPECGTCEAW